MDTERVVQWLATAKFHVVIVWFSVIDRMIHSSSCISQESESFTSGTEATQAHFWNAEFELHGVHVFHWKVQSLYHHMKCREITLQCQM